MSADPIRVLFVCIENSNRSQIAEAFARIHGGQIEAYSAGSQPGEAVNPRAVSAMKEVGYDLTRHETKSVDELPEVEFDVLVTMGCGDTCPRVRAKQRQDWSIPDPRAMSPDEFRAVRDLIEESVRRLLEHL